nr:hypothetical protein [Tanacetum cinerariifolium]
MYVSGHVDIFDMVVIDLFTVVALNMMVLKLGYIEHGVTALDSYLRAPRFRATLEEIFDEPGSIAANRTKKMLLLTWHESSETTKEPVCDFIIPSSLPQHDSSTPCKDSVCESITPRCMLDRILSPLTDESVITYAQLSGVQGVDIQIHVLSIIQSQFSDINLSFVSQQATASQVIDDVMRQLSFDETELEGEAGFAGVAGSGVDSLRLNVGRTQEPILAEVSTQEPIVAEVSTQKPIVADVSTKGNGQKDESAPTEGQFFNDDEGIDTAYEI